MAEILMERVSEPPRIVKATKLKIASVMSLWYGIISGTATAIVEFGIDIPRAPFDIGGTITSVSDVVLVFLFIPASIWMSRGQKRGIVLALGLLFTLLTIYTASAVVGFISGTALWKLGFFTILLMLIISGRNELSIIKEHRWSPLSPRKNWKGLEIKKESKRPIGVSLLSFYFLIGGILILVGSIALVLIFNFDIDDKFHLEEAIHFVNPFHPSIDIGKNVVIVFGCLGILYLIISRSLAGGKSWGRKLLIITQAVSVGISGYTMMGEQKVIESMWIGIDLLVIFYMFRPNVVEYFQRNQNT